ncbi:hypothetical protein EXVG_00204 [Emiliania huxleyi virus 202]|nr:hypothetical protein EXVG_00204 [Emiliania huxleyi virus 202]AHA54178.1 putative membrane protein [Emiliania huxleyi virus 18]AHA55224.1 putative membrane protein [Emiliania huxleyi virus 156]
MVSHTTCDTALLTICLFITLQYYSVSDLNAFITTTISTYPNIYTSKFVYNETLNPFFTTAMYLIGLYAILKLDYGEFLTNTSSIYNVIELTLGFLSVFYNVNWLTLFFIMFTIATTHQKQIVYFMGPWYMRLALNHLYRFFVLTEAIKSLSNPYNAFAVWTVTYVNITIRLLSYFVTPYVSHARHNGPKLLLAEVDPLCTTFSSYLGFYITMAFVLSPNTLLGCLPAIAMYHMMYPPKLTRPNGSIRPDIYEPTNMSVVYDRLFFGILFALLVSAWKIGGLDNYIGYLFQNFKQFPNHFIPNTDYMVEEMKPFICLNTYAVTVYFLIKTYYVERRVVDRAHKKYNAHNVSLYVMLHGIGSAIELTLGMFAILYPDKYILSYFSAGIALINNIPTGFVLTPCVYGVKHITVPGFAIFGIIRILECVRVFFVHPRNYPNAWILLQVGTIVRLLGYFVLPFSSINGSRGDLFTEPLNYSTNILLSGYIAASYVYHPAWLVLSLFLYAGYQKYNPHTISAKMRPVLREEYHKFY